MLSEIHGLSRVGRALCFSLGLLLAPSAIAAEDPSADMNAADYDAKARDIDTQMRDIINAPVDFCNRAAIDEQNRVYTHILFEKLQLQREREKIHPTIKQDVQKVVQDFADNGLGRVNSPIVDEYDVDVTRGDTMAAGALLARMTPWESARAAAIRKDWPQALKLLTSLADQGDVGAQAELGGLYSWGTVVAPSAFVLRDDAQALKYLRLAAANGEELSQEMLAKHYTCGLETDIDLVHAYAWFSLALARSAVMLRTSDKPEEILRERDFLAGKMSRDDIQRAKHLLIKCHQSQYKECD